MSTFTPIKFDKYLLLDRIAVGGMAEVFRAKLIGEKGFEKPVVVKKLLPYLIEDQEMETLLIDEARLAALLDHENIIRVQDCGIFEESLYIAMEYLFGKDLNQVIQEGLTAKRPMNLANIMHVVIRICDGLAYAHELTDLEGNPLHIIHRDVSPHNVFITWEGQVKLIDFGIAKAANRSTRTRTGIIKGKAAYMAPEQAEGKAIDHRADIFPVGIILYELVTRRKMFSGDTFEVLSRVIRAEYEPPEAIVKNLPPSLAAIIHKALEKDPEQRYASCEAMADDLRACLYELKIRPSPRKMSAYLQSLYGDRYAREKQEMVAMMKTDASGAAVSGEGTVSPPPEPTQALDSPENNSTGTRSITPTGQFVVCGDETMQTQVDRTEAVTATQLQPPVSEAAPGKGRRTGMLAICLLVLAGLAGGTLYLKPWYEKRTRIRTHLQDAAASLEGQRLFSPANDNARYYYQQALALDPANRDAKAGLRGIVETSIRMAEADIGQRKLRSARKTIRAGQTIDPDNRRLKELSGQVAALEAEKKKKAEVATTPKPAKRKPSGKKEENLPAPMKRFDRKVKSVVNKVKGIFN